ncbi:hypothetical protein [Hymenobacter chitinivorans]|uniref:hypothetical protein n=1 Tax=Hymenobacter chitinivorans TaxID=89969 RepID=UPI000C250FC6|nr:hypothetical protein [Hymenobacter chitinivorans]
MIRSRVAAAGHNARVVIVKSCIGYYIIPLKSIQDQEMKIAEVHYVKVDVRSNIMGPFTKAAFNQQLVLLGEDSLMRFDQQLADCQ